MIFLNILLIIILIIGYLIGFYLLIVRNDYFNPKLWIVLFLCGPICWTQIVIILMFKCTAELIIKIVNEIEKWL